MEKSNSRRSVVWAFFNIKDKFIASCKACGKELSHRTTVSNLAKHLKRKHSDIISFKQSKDCSDACSDNSDDDDDGIKKDSEEKKSNSSSTWQHFDVLDSDKARCKVCQKDITYDSISDLTEHVKEHDEVASDDEKEDLSSKKTSFWCKSSRRRSMIWHFLNPVDDTTASCKLCSRNLSFATSIGNLRKHFKRTHPNVDLDKPILDNKKKVIISTNGQLYEIQTTDDEKDPIQTDEIYLEDSLDGNYVEHFETVTAAPETPPPPIVKKPKKPEKRTLKRNIHYSINKSNSSDEDVPVKKAPKTNSSLDLFGQYIISLLKDMPRNVSDQLQSEIIKQIMNAKTAYNTPYSVTLSDKPVTVTLNNVSCKSMPEITVNDVGDVIVSKESSNSELTNDK